MKKLLYKKGFTIVELVIVIAVIAILAAVLIPTFSNVIDSAKETATLQEAKGTLDSYIGVMTADGTSLPDGTVFIVFDTEKDATENNKNKIAGAFVFFKGSLHKFDYYSTADSDKLKPSNVEYSQFKLPSINGNPVDANTYIYWTNAQLKDFTTAENFYFAYNQDTAVGFDGGSTKCKIYSGSVISKVTEITLSAKDKDDKDITTLTVNADKKEYTLNNVDVTADYVIKFSATTKPEGSKVVYELNAKDGVATLDSATGTLTINAKKINETIKVTVSAGGYSVVVIINTKSE